MSKLEVRQLTFGKGVFATERISNGERIIAFTGPLLRYRETTPETYALQIGEDLYIGASGALDDYINHSCEPNAGMKIRGTEAVLHAIRDIEAGEQIAFDYSTVMAEDDFEMKCWCGTASCRGMIRDGKHLPEEVWERYLGLGILPEHVIESKRRMQAG